VKVVDGLTRRADEYQRTHAWTAFPFAVMKKFGDDRAGRLAALIAYYAFFSLFPLLMVLVTLLGILMSDHPEFRDRIVDSALSQLPIIGPQLARDVHGFRGSLPVLAIGIVGALWSGMAVVGAAQNAMNEVWDVPRVREPNFLAGRLRSLLMLLVGGVGVVVAGTLAGAAATGSVPWSVRALALLGSLLVNVALFAASYRILTVADVTWRQVAPGAAVAAAAWSVLQLAGGFVVQRQIRGASEVYGVFAIVIGLLSWTFLAAQVTLIGAEINVVAARRLWPRSLVPPPLSDADERSLARQAEEQTMRPEQDVDVRFHSPTPTGESDRSADPGVRTPPPG
jgi:YihY family inner membrane protein